MFAWTPNLPNPDEPTWWSCPSCAPEQVLGHLDRADRLRLVKALQISHRLTVRIHCHTYFPQYNRLNDPHVWFFEVGHWISGRAGGVEWGWLRKEAHVSYVTFHEIVSRLEKGVF